MNNKKITATKNQSGRKPVQECLKSLRMDWSAKADEIRAFCNIPYSARNIAIARCFINGETFEIFAISGKKSPNNSVGLPQNPVFKLLEPPSGHDRQYDSEYKLLEEIAARYTSNQKVHGRIELFTERKPCLSCADVIEQFRQKFPNIELVVLSGG